MAIKYLGNPNMPGGSSANIPEAVGVSVEALSMLNLKVATDKEALAEKLKQEYTQLVAGQDRSGEPYVQLELDSDNSLRAMLDTIDGNMYNGHTYPMTSIWHDTSWTSRGKNISGSPKSIIQQDDEGVGSSELTGHSRLALGDGVNLKTPYIHFTNKPYDEMSLDPDSVKKETQLEALAKEKEQYESSDPDFNMKTMDVASFAMLVLQHRIRGETKDSLHGVM